MDESSPHEQHPDGMRYFYARTLKELFPDKDEHHIILDTKGKCTYYIGGETMKKEMIEIDAEQYLQSERRFRKEGGHDVFRAIIGSGMSYWDVEMGLYEGAAKERIDDIIKRHKLKKF